MEPTGRCACPSPLHSQCKDLRRNDTPHASLAFCNATCDIKPTFHDIVRESARRTHTSSSFHSTTHLAWAIGLYVHTNTSVKTIAHTCLIKTTSKQGSQPPTCLGLCIISSSPKNCQNIHPPELRRTHHRRPDHPSPCDHWLVEQRPNEQSTFLSLNKL
jgi:hypothetical protein